MGHSALSQYARGFGADSHCFYYICDLFEYHVGALRHIEKPASHVISVLVVFVALMLMVVLLVFHLTYHRYLSGRLFFMNLERHSALSALSSTISGILQCIPRIQ